MSRAAFVPSSDPFVLLHFYHYFKTVWYDEVDKLYIVFSSELSPEIVNELHTLVQDNKVVFIHTDHTLSHGDAIKKFLSQCLEEFVVLLEDDSIVFHKGIIDEYFCRVEDDMSVVASERMSCHPDVAELAKKMFSLDYTKRGDVGCSFWPCFVWMRKEELEACERFGATHLGDTFVFASLLIRNWFVAKEILTIPQYHLSPIDNYLKEEGASIFDGNCDYLHIGSLSSGMENTLVNDENVPLKYWGRDSAKSVFVAPTTDQEKMELERRVIFWRKAHELHDSSFGSFGEEYKKAIQRVVDRCGLDIDRMWSFEELYYGVIND